MKYLALSLALLLFAPLALSQMDKQSIVDYIEEQERAERQREQSKEFNAAVQRAFRNYAANPPQPTPEIHIHGYNPRPRVPLPHLQHQRRITPFTCSRVGNFVNCY